MKLLTVVTYDDFYTVNILEQEDYVLIVETITITPINSIQLRKEDFLLGLGYETYSNCDRYQSSIDYNIEKNQYDIFNQEVSEKVTYHFCFIVPKVKNDISYDQVLVSFLIFHNYLLVNISN